MTALTLASLLLAQLDQRDILKAMRGGFEDRGGDSLSFPTLLIGVAVFAGLVTLVALVARRRRPRHAPRFDHLSHSATMLGLGRAQLSDLQAVASRAGLPHPAAMLLSPANLAHAISAASDLKDDPDLRERLDGISRSVFGTPLPDRLED